MPAARRFPFATLAATGVFALAVPLRVAGSDVTPVQPAPVDDSIAAAQRQLDALKVDANSRAAGARNSLPTLALPEPGVPSDADAVAMPAKPDQPTKQPKRDPNNWLVDAMMTPRERSSKDGERRSDSRDPRGRAFDAKGHPSLTRDDEDQSDLDSRDHQPTKSAADRDRALSEKEPAKDSFNPLDQYMADWLAPRDYELLRRTVQPESSSPLNGPDRPGAQPGPGESAALAGIASFDRNLDVSEQTARATLPKPADNPYLQLLALPEPAPIEQVPPPPAAVLSAPAPMMVPPAPPSVPSTGLPDFVRPATDEKYFKPLKRF